MRPEDIGDICDFKKAWKQAEKDGRENEFLHEFFTHLGAGFSIDCSLYYATEGA